MTNLSFILHDHSESQFVAEVADKAASHAQFAGSAAALALPLVDGDQIPDAEIWLTASIGIPTSLERYANQQASAPVVLRVDASHDDTAAREVFFRAPACLALPASRDRIVTVVAAVRRPGGHSLEAVSRGPFEWPSDRDAVLQALEWLIQRHAGQWFAPRQLWEGPAEVLLPAGEIVTPAAVQKHR